MRHFAAFLLAAAIASGAPDYTAVFDAPPPAVPTRGMPGGPLLGNGDVGVVIGGPAEAQSFYIGKNDFWTSFRGDPNTRVQSKVINVGRIELTLPALRDATYRQEQDLAKAEVRGTFTKDALTVRTRSWVQANENLLLTELLCEGAPVTVMAQSIAGGGDDNVPPSVLDNGRPATIGRELHGGGRWQFDGEIAGVVVTNAVLSGKPAGQPGAPTQLKELPVAKMGKTVSVAAWIRIGGANGEANYIVSKGEWNQAYSLGLSGGKLRWAINGTFVQTEQPLPTGQWLYVAGTFDGHRMRAYVNGELRASRGESGGGTTASCFTRKADQEPGGREVAVATRAIGQEGTAFELKPGTPVVVATAILSDLDAKDFRSAAKKMAAEADLAELEKRHRQWWAAFWSRSFIEIPDKLIEKHWYAALYTMASCSRAGKVAPGLWGNWLTTDHPNWQGDFHLNYNFQAPFYLVYASNHPEVSLPFYQAIKEALPAARAMAKRHGWKGVHFPCGIGPWGLFGYSGELDHGQRSNAAYVALNFLWYWQYTQDGNWLKTEGYPYLREVAGFWEDYLKFEDGRYVIHGDAIHEGSGDNMNPLLSLGLLRTLFKNMLAMSAELGLDADKRAKWQDILHKLSAFPLQQRGGKTVFRYSERGTDWWPSNTLGIQHIFPAGAIGLDSDPKLLEVSRNMIDALNRWADYNGFSSFYTAAARVGYDPQVILKNLRIQCDKHSLPNLVAYYGGGGIEGCGGFLVVNEMMLQSHEGVIRLFPCWPRELNARFGNLRAVGAFLVSAELKNGEVTGVKIVSERGRDCTVQNPWPGRRAQIAGREVLDGQRFTFRTKPGEGLVFTPQ